MIPSGVRDRGHESAISRNLPASSSNSSSSSNATSEPSSRFERLADSRRTGTVLDVITREITCGFERASPISLPPPFTLLPTPFHPATSSRARVAISTTTARPRDDVRCATHLHSTPPPPPESSSSRQHQRDMGKLPRWR